MALSFAAVVIFIISFSSLFAGEVPSTVYFLDAAKEEVQLQTTNGYMELFLPPAADPVSLRVRPLGNYQIKRVAVVAAASDAKAVKEQQALQDRKDALQDRLRALAIREDVFASAAKTQSGKAPRKTKTNPEPVVDIRKGTEFALDQLEEVFRLRRKVQAELETIDAKLKTLEHKTAPLVAKIWLPGKGRVAVGYVRKDRRWLPNYAVRIIGAQSLSIELHAITPEPMSDAAVVNSLHSASRDATPRRVSGDYPLVVSVQTPVTRTGTVFSFTNTLPEALPAGEAMVFEGNEYIGTVNFPACAAGATADITLSPLLSSR